MNTTSINLETRDERLHRLIAPDAMVAQIATGFQFTEGPAWEHATGSLIFSDIIGDAMYRWSARAGIAVFRRPSHKANGNTFDRQGRLLTCEHVTSRVSRTSATGSYEVLAAEYDGKELNSPNDIVAAPDSAIYFTDPTSGRTARYGVERPQVLTFQGVYRIDPHSGALMLLVDDFAKPNGLCFSLDDTQLFINDTNRAHIRVFDVQSDGTLANGRLWANLVGSGAGVADGMKVDCDGNLYCCGPGGIHVFAPDATSLGVIRLPEYVANFAWGEEDLSTLYVTASTSVYVLPTLVAGREF